MAAHRVAKVEEIPLGEGRVLNAGSRQVAVFNVGGRFHALDNTCPHKGGPLGDGMLSGAVVICPWHGWQFDCLTGKSTINPSVQVACFPTRVEGDCVLVEI